MKRIFTYCLLAASLLSGACSKEDCALSELPQPAQGGIVLRIGAGAYLEAGSTRASDDGAVTHFESGDRVGVLISEDGTPIEANNLPFVCDGQGNWTFDEATASTEGTGKALYTMNAGAGKVALTVYYPYMANADNASGTDDLKRILAPLDDQSSEENYRLSDLMFWTDTRPATDLTVDATLTHAYASVSLKAGDEYELETGDRITIAPSDVNFTVGDKVNITPYRAEDGSYRLILPSDFTGGEVRWFYTFGGVSYGGSRTLSSVAANTRYSKTETEDKGRYGLENARIGDFYCTKDDGASGYVIPQEADAATVQAATVVGIVFQTDKKRIGTKEKEKLGGEEKVHGLVMAVKNAATSQTWGPYGTDEELTKCESKADNYNDISGYGNCERIRTNRGSFDSYPAFKAADDYNAGCPVPETTTGWYLPASGQWWDILQNLGGCPILADKSEQTSSATGDFTWSGQGDVPAALNNWMAHIADGNKNTFRSGDWFWSSSERSSRNARRWRVNSNGDVGCYWRYKNGSYDVRPVLAF